eukprot:m.198828 g.198828  ORF g.198828 m.198828 type:complete len:69 (+) comp39563_c1_seq20:558-764(+)
MRLITSKCNHLPQSMPGDQVGEWRQREQMHSVLSVGTHTFIQHTATRKTGQMRVVVQVVVEFKAGDRE